MFLLSLFLAQTSWLRQENIFGLGILFTVVAGGVGIIGERLTRIIVGFLREKNLASIDLLRQENLANAATDKLKLDECMESKGQQALALDSFREAVQDFSTLSDLLKGAIESIRSELANVRKERDDLRGKLDVMRTLQTEHLRDLQMKTQAQLEQLTLILTKMAEPAPLGVTTTTTVVKTAELTEAHGQ